MIHRETVEFGGREFSIEVGRIAKQAGGSAWVSYGDSRVLVCATALSKGREGIDFFPLTVDYQEKIFAVGRFPGGFIKRETRPQTRETLVSRMIDRPIRPLFPEAFNNETQVIAQVFSADMENETDIMAMIGASAALEISDIPFAGPIGGARIGYIDGEIVCNPKPVDMKRSKMNIFVAASADAIVMVECEADEVSEEIVVEALMKAYEWIQPVIELQVKLREKVGKAKMAYAETERDEEVYSKVKEIAIPDLKEAYTIKPKMERYAAVSNIKAKIKEELADLEDDKKSQISSAFEDIKHHYVRSLYTEENRRIDFREWDEIRQITCETGLLPRVHGSALFTRGETQALVAMTMGTKTDAQKVDDMIGDRSKPFILHYNFPPYSVGEVKRFGAAGRRELGHGNLAERALKRMVPAMEKEFPYTIRVSSEITESNGSSSMATVCGGCLSMMDAGVPIRKPVAGIAMGMIEDGDNFFILSDILGEEDHLGDMDFKVCGTKDGITAIQMDLKVQGITKDVLTKALDQAKAGRMHILGKMLEHLPEPRTEYSNFAPKIVTINIKQDRIRDVIGKGGATIREIVEQTTCQINVEDDGTVIIASPSGEACDKAIEIIKGLTEEPEVGKTYSGKVKRVVQFGAFVEIIPGIEGLLHISEIAHRRIDQVEDEVNEGDIIDVKILDIERNGKLRLSRRALLPTPEGYEERGDRRPRSDRSRSDRDRGRGGNRR